MILGITGGFGCGKSSVLHFFRTHSYFVMDADLVCHSLYDHKHPELMECIRKQFGDMFFTANGSVDRKKMAEKLFAYPEKMSAITSVIYPLLTGEILRGIEHCRKNNQHGAFEIPLLYEAGFEQYFDAVLAVWCPDDIRKQRLRKRNFSEKEFEKRNLMQISQNKKLERADFGIVNNGSLEDLYKQLTILTDLFK